jgi:amino acid adenylation domain-containing protein
MDSLNPGAAGTGTADDAALVPDLIERQAALSPDAPAVSCGGQVLSYRELLEVADRLARLLRHNGAGPGTLVAVHLARSVDLVAAILAVLRSGAAYLPLDPAYPTERTRFMLRDAAPAMLITDSRLPEVPADGERVTVELDRTELNAWSEDPLAGARLDPALPAYVIYTSGSSGTPKGVMATQANLAQSTVARLRRYPEPVGAFLLVSPVAFDSSVAGLFWTLSTGGHLVISPSGMEHDVKQVAALIAEHGVTHLLGVPSWYSELLNLASPEQLDSLRVAITAGEPVPSGLPDRHYQRVPTARLYNEYGLTECSVWSTVHECAPGEGQPVPIGRPVDGTDCYVLDDRLRPVEPGEIGELYVGGAGVTVGYLGRRALTAARFCPDPFSGRPGARLYRTGDLGRVRYDGEIECLGRNDHQVKISGYRVEPGEVESVLSGHPDVRGSVVTAHEFGPDDRRLVAYIVTDGSAEADHFRRFLADRVPEHMVPSVFMLVDELPVSPSGKVDRGRLPDPQPNRDAAEHEFVAPRTELEAEVAGLFAEMLHVDRVGLHDNFFDLGGTSILFVQFSARLAGTYGMDRAMTQVLRSPTVADTAQLIATARAGRREAALASTVELAETDARLDESIDPEYGPTWLKGAAR